jgi:hypothetical protein
MYATLNIRQLLFNNNIESNSPSCIARSQEQSARSATCGTASGLSPEAEIIQARNYFQNKV